MSFSKLYNIKLLIISLLCGVFSIAIAIAIVEKFVNLNLGCFLQVFNLMFLIVSFLKKNSYVIFLIRELTFDLAFFILIVNFDIGNKLVTLLDCVLLIMNIIVCAFLNSLGSLKPDFIYNQVLETRYKSGLNNFLFKVWFKYDFKEYKS